METLSLGEWILEKEKGLGEMQRIFTSIGIPKYKYQQIAVSLAESMCTEFQP